MSTRKKSESWFLVQYDSPSHGWSNSTRINNAYTTLADARDAVRRLGNLGMAYRIVRVTPVGKSLLIKI